MLVGCKSNQKSGWFQRFLKFILFMLTTFIQGTLELFASLKKSLIDGMEVEQFLLGLLDAKQQEKYSKQQALRRAKQAKRRRKVVKRVLKAIKKVKPKKAKVKAKKLVKFSTGDIWYVPQQELVRGNDQIARIAEEDNSEEDFN